MSVSEAIWHEVECGGYAEDLTLWEELAAETGSPVLDLGCGTGRVALHLSRRGHDVHGVDIDPALIGILEAAAAAESLTVSAQVGDVRDLSLAHSTYPLAIAAMQLLQLVGGPSGRAGLLQRVAGAMAPRGLAGFAIVEGVESVVGEADPETLPDVREREGWLHSSLPLEVSCRDDVLEVHRLRQTVSPDGELSEDEHFDFLDVIDAGVVEAEGRAAGLQPAGRRAISESPMHVGSTVVLLRREA